MTPKEAALRMKDIIENNGTEDGHIEADELMTTILRELGYGEMVDLYEAEDWWYA